MKYLNRKYQQGGTAQGGDPQAQMAQQIAQALQQGTKPEVLLQALVKQGMPQDQAQQMIQAVMQQMQGGAQGGQAASAKNGAKLEFVQRLQGGRKIWEKTGEQWANEGRANAANQQQVVANQAATQQRFNTSKPTNFRLLPNAPASNFQLPINNVAANNQAIATRNASEASAKSWMTNAPENTNFLDLGKGRSNVLTPVEQPVVNTNIPKAVATPTTPAKSTTPPVTTTQTVNKPVTQPVNNVHSPVSANNATLTPDQVKWVQTHLNSMGHNLEVDGKYGKETMKAIGEIQSSVGLPATGQWDEATRDVFKTLDRTGRDAKQSYLDSVKQNNAAGDIPEITPTTTMNSTINTQPSILEGTSFAKKGGYLQQGGKTVTKPVLKNKPTNAAEAASDAVIPTKNEGGTDMNPNSWKPGVSNTANKTKNIPSDNKVLIPSSKEKGGKVIEDKCGGKMKTTKKAQGGYLKNSSKTVPTIPVKKDMSAMIKPTSKPMMSNGSKVKPKKCLKGCGCGAKLHKNGGVLTTVCSCCGGICN